MAGRLKKLREKLIDHGLDAILVSQGENRRYLSGFTGSAGLLLISGERAILATDFRYVEQARAEVPDFEIVRMQGAPSEWFPTLMSGLDVQKLGFEGRDLAFSNHKELAAAVSQIGGEINLVPTEGVVESLRAVKEEEELRCLEEAAALADAALEQVLPLVRPGISERE